MAQTLRQPQVACADDYDSEAGDIRPNTRTFARNTASQSRTESRQRGRANTSVPPPPVLGSRRSSTPAAPTVQLQRTESQRRVQIHAPELHRNNPARVVCRDPNCRQPNCTASQVQRTYTITPQPQYTRPPPVLPPVAQTVVSPYAFAQPRPRVNSISSQRPTSWAAPTNVPIYSPHYHPQPVQYGPPPSPSAYRNMQAQIAYASVNQPRYTQPPDPMTTAMAGLAISRPSSTFSARTLPAQYATPQPTTMPLTRTVSLSARRPSETRTALPGTYPMMSAEEVMFLSDEDPEYERRSSKRDSKMEPSPRPSMRSTKTAPAYSTRVTQPERAPSDNGVDYMMADPERTPRPSVTRRLSSAHSSSRSRRPSSTASSSGRTKATTISSGSGSRVQDRQTDQLADAMAYQRNMRGPQPAELTAENIRQMDERLVPPTRSRASGHSRKSGTSGSRDGVRFKYKESNYEFDPNTHVEFCPENDGKPAHFIVTPNSAIDAAESKSSSRTGRSRGGSERGSISREQPILETVEG